MRPHLLLVVLLTCLLPVPAGATRIVEPPQEGADRRPPVAPPVPLPGGRPSAFLPADASIWLATEAAPGRTLAAAGVQALPGVSLAVRLTEFNESVADVALTLVPETDVRPALTVGWSGLGGFGPERSRHVALGRRWRFVEMTGGVAWTGSGGPFGGTPRPFGVLRLVPERIPLSLTVEAGRLGDRVHPRAIATWQPRPWLELAGGWELRRGPVIGITLRADPDRLPRLAPPPAIPLETGPGRAAIAVPLEQPAALALGRAARSLAAPSVADGEGSVTVDLQAGGLPGTRVELIAADLARAAEARGSVDEIAANARFGPASRPVAGAAPLATARLTLRTDQGPGIGAAGWLYRTGVDAEATLHPLPWLTVGGAVRLTVDDTFFALLPPDGDPVRGDVSVFAGERLGPLRAYGAVQGRLAGPWYGRLEAGLLEEAYAGLGGELLRRPFDAAWWVSVDLHHVVRRFPGTPLPRRPIFDLSSRRTTGFVTVGSDLPGVPGQVELLAGRFLDGGAGAALRLDRHFAAGTRVALEVVFASGISPALTVTLPFWGTDLPLGVSAGARARRIGLRTGAATRIATVGRDAGQRLDRPDRLADLLGPATLGRVAETWPRLLD